MVKIKTIFLDRDGVVNHAQVSNGKPYPPLKVVSARPVEGIKDLIKKWHKAGWLVIVVTNQPDVANHITDKNQVNKINNHLKALVGFDDIFTCFHGEKDNCDCRKPKIGLFKQAHEKYNIDFSESWMIGDRWKDIEAGKKVGCKTIFVDYNYSEVKPDNADYIVKDIKDVGKITGV